LDGKKAFRFHAFLPASLIPILQGLEKSSHQQARQMLCLVQGNDMTKRYGHLDAYRV
jgi:hypothetical protein